MWNEEKLNEIWSDMMTNAVAFEAIKRQMGLLILTLHEKSVDDYVVKTIEPHDGIITAVYEVIEYGAE